VARAVRRIEEGALNDGSVSDLARELGVTTRHLLRCVQAELGVSPVDLALSRRLALSRELIHGTTLRMTDIAFASGFRSLRRFNDAFRSVHGRAPLEMRRAGNEKEKNARRDAVQVRLEYRAPYDWASILAFLRTRAVRGVEAVVEGAYVRAVRIGDRRGWIAVRPGKDNGLSLEVAPSLAAELLPLVARVRRLFDLDARPAAIAEHLRRDARLAPLVEARPGLRAPGAFDPFEAAALAVLGQQVTVRAAVTLASRLVEAFGEEVATPFAAVGRLWPTLDRLARSREATIARLGMPGARARALLHLAKAASSGSLDLASPSSIAELEAPLLAIPGIGPWTAQYILMRAAAWPDAFPVFDAGLAAALGVPRRDVTTDIAAAWRPWRSYATIHLWTALAGDRS
jgi:AraC family transcriptional regulator of adaptative response / DNA-3-methyladenine glycosylase II